MTTHRRIVRDAILGALLFVLAPVFGAQEVNYAERVKGAWRAVQEDGKQITLVLDGVATNPGTSLQGNSTYNIRGNHFIFAFNGVVMASEIELVSDDEMVMTRMRTGVRQTWVRRPVDAMEPATLSAQAGATATAAVIRANEIALLKIQGRWKAIEQDGRAPEFDEIEIGMLRVQFPGKIDLAALRDAADSGASLPGKEPVVQSIYRLFAERLDFNWKGRIASYRVGFPLDGSMVLTDPGTNQMTVFRRID